MNSVFDNTSVQPLILELLARRNRFEPRQIEEFGELLEKSSPGTVPEAVLIRGGYISDHEVAGLYAEDLFLPDRAAATTRPPRSTRSWPASSPRSSAPTS